MLLQHILAGLALLAGSLIAISPASAMSLAEAVALARGNDPIYLSAGANLTATLERSQQAQACLYPQISASFNTAGNRRNYEVREGAATKDSYNSNSAQLSLNQPLWHHAKRIAAIQAGLSATQADYQHAAALQDLLLRLAQAWFDWMQARDEAALGDAQAAVAKQQWAQAKRAFELGMASWVAVEEAQAKYELAVADYTGAEAEQKFKVAALEQILGAANVAAPPFLAENYVATDPRPGAFLPWQQHAEQHSPSVLAALRGLDAANEEVHKQRASHEPTLDLVASSGRNAQQTGSFPGQSGFNIRQDSIALQFNVPLYSGGGLSAKVAEAIALREKAEMDVNAARRNVRQACNQAWYGWQAASARHSAALQSLRFSRSSLDSAIHGRDHELKTGLDVMLARLQFYGARRDVQKARYHMMINQMKLKAAAGELADQDLAALDLWMSEAEPPN